MPRNEPPVVPAITAVEARKIYEMENPLSINKIVRKINNLLRKAIKSKATVLLNQKDLGESVDVINKIVKHYEAAGWTVTPQYGNCYEFTPYKSWGK